MCAGSNVSEFFKNHSHIYLLISLGICSLIGFYAIVWTSIELLIGLAFIFPFCLITVNSIAYIIAIQRTSPQDIDITHEGIKINEKVYYWQYLKGAKIIEQRFAIVIHNVHNYISLRLNNSLDKKKIVHNIQWYIHESSSEENAA